VTEQELKEIRARVDAATPGPWVRWTGGIVLQDDHSFVCEASHFTDRLHPGNAADAAFIAHARTDVVKLLDEVVRLKRIIEKELTENDELGREFVYVNILKEQNARLRTTLDNILHWIAGNEKDLPWIEKKILASLEETK